jgi:PAS domain-containing protein
VDTTLIQSYFAPPERAEAAEISAQYRRLRATPLIQQLLDCFPEPAMILNPQRQVVQANNALAGLLKVEATELLGLRPGEILNCIHAHECAGGCGTSKFCRQCGAVRAIWDASRTQTDQCEECRITCANRQGHVSLDLRVWATPLDFDKSFIVFAVRDITDEKRRAILERLFFHDVLNAAGGLKGIIEILPDLSQGEAAEMGRIASDLAEELLAEIRSHRDLVAAERGDLVPEWTEVDAGEILTQLCLLYGHHSVAANKELPPPVLSGSRTIYSDRTLLSRVLGNLIKNALEASSSGQTVHVSFKNSGMASFSVHNETVMPEEVQLQVFQRSFSTKAKTGRGIGTYSVRLLTERYLKGEVSFTSSKDAGTTLTLTLPSCH